MVKLDPAKLAADNITISQIQGLLAANNLVLPAGSLPTTVDGATVSIPVSAQHQLVLQTKEDLLAPGRRRQGSGRGLRLDRADSSSPSATSARSSRSRSTRPATRS